jgi:hypothetical protein
MTRLVALIILFVFALTCQPVLATVEVGLNGHTSWSDNHYIGNPKGWGLVVSKSLSSKVSLRLSHSRFNNDFRYIGNFLFGFLPPDVDTSKELIQADAATNYTEILLLHALVNGDKLRLDIGGGFGIGYFDLDLLGQSTGESLTTNEDGLTLTWLIETTVKQFVHSPMALKVGYQYHRSSTLEGGITDAFVPFDDIALSGVYAAVVARW